MAAVAEDVAVEVPLLLKQELRRDSRLRRLVVSVGDSAAAASEPRDLNRA